MMTKINKKRVRISNKIVFIIDDKKIENIINDDVVNVFESIQDRIISYGHYIKIFSIVLFERLNLYNNEFKLEIYHKNGNIYNEVWFKNKELYREKDLPSLVQYYNNGKISTQYWIVGDKLYRLYKPAYITYNLIGNITTQTFYINNYDITKNILKYKFIYETEHINEFVWIHSVYEDEVNETLKQYNVEKLDDNILKIVKLKYGII